MLYVKVPQEYRNHTVLRMALEEGNFKLAEYMIKLGVFMSGVTSVSVMEDGHAILHVYA